MSQPLWAVIGVVGVAVAGAAIEARGDRAPARTSVTIWRSPAPASPWGGATYGGLGDSIAFVTDRRQVEVPASGELAFDGVAAQIEPATVQLRSVTDPATVVLEQRFVRGLASPDELLTRHIGKHVVVTTDRGEVAGTLRAVDRDSLVVEVGAGARRTVDVLRRGDFVRDIKLTGAAAATDLPSLAWKLKTARPGAHAVEVSYRARGGLTWAPDYTATLDESRQLIDFTAIATIQNQTGVDFDDVELTLVTGPLDQPSPTPTTSFTVPRRVELGRGESVQLELIPAKVGAKASRLVVFEAAPDQSFNYTSYPGTECYAFVPGQRTTAQVAIDVSVGANLPAGKVRLFKRSTTASGAGSRLEVDSEDTLHVEPSTGIARIRVNDADTDVIGERKQLECRHDERTRTLREKIEVRVENRSKRAHDVVIREYMYRWMTWRIEAEDAKGAKAAAQTQEYRARIPAGGKRAVTYTVLYSW